MNEPSLTHTNPTPPLPGTTSPSLDSTLPSDLRFPDRDLNKPIELIFNQPGASPISMLVASLGVRGLLAPRHPHQANGNVDDITMGFIAEGCEILRERDIKRIHAFIPIGAQSLHQIFIGAGFRHCEGETLFEAHPNSSRSVRPALPDDFTIRQAIPNDVFAVAEIFANLPEVAFQSWETSLLLRDFGRADRMVLVVENSGRIVGALVGGSAGTRATISHLWIAPEFRMLKLGQSLVEESLSRFANSGVEIVHLMTTRGNESANAFWRSTGFSESKGTYFLERDLH